MDGKVHFTGPLINEVAEPPEIAELFVFVTDKRFAPEVVSIPLVRVNVPATPQSVERVTPVLIVNGQVIGTG